MAQAEGGREMRVAFVNPPVTREERYGSLAAAGSYAPPLALRSLAAVTRRAGYDTVIVDAPVEGLDHEGSLRRIEAHKADVVGITSVTSTFGMTPQRLPISFENEIIVARSELAVYLIISAVFGFVWI